MRRENKQHLPKDPGHKATDKRTPGLYFTDNEKA
jgi:hypothetical protein